MSRVAETSIQPIRPDDLGAVLELNNAHAAELSLLDDAGLRQLVGAAFYANRVGALEAFLLAFDEGGDYASPNFLWFRDRYPRFVYVDRIVVAQHARGRKLARRLYEDLFAQAKTHGHTMIGCEVNAEPPNPASDAFHAALGFVEVGSAAIHGGAKTVRYFVRAL
jgi:uncharacterized protein